MTDTTFAIVSVTCALLATGARVTDGMLREISYLAAVAFVVVAVLNTLGVI